MDENHRLKLPELNNRKTSKRRGIQLLKNLKDLVGTHLLHRQEQMLILINQKHLLQEKHLPAQRITNPLLLVLELHQLILV